MDTHPYIAAQVENRRFVFVYGPYGTGKTRLAVHVARLASKLGLNPVFLETEAVGSIVSRLYEGLVESAKSFDELARLVAYHSLGGRYLVVDSVNSFYRSEPPSVRRRILAFIASCLRKTGGLAVGQARLAGDELTSPGLRVISHYAEIVAFTSRVGSEKFKLEVLKPERRVLLFRLAQGDVEWL